MIDSVTKQVIKLSLILLFFIFVLGVRQEQDIYVRLIDSVTKQVIKRCFVDFSKKVKTTYKLAENNVTYKIKIILFKITTNSKYDDNNIY